MIPFERSSWCSSGNPTTGHDSVHIIARTDPQCVVGLADYPQLEQLAWQVHGTDELTPAEALSIYRRNWRHVDANALEPRERDLIDALRIALGDQGGDV